MEAFCRRVVIYIYGKRVRKLTRRVIYTHEYPCSCKASFHSALPCKKSRTYLITVLDPLGIYNTAHIKDYYSLCKSAAYFADHLLLSICKIEISLREDPACSFGHADFCLPGIVLTVILYI